MDNLTLGSGLTFSYTTGIVTDPYWSNVTFLENFESPQTAFVDSSTNNQAVTIAAGVPLPNYNKPFTVTSGSIYFNGSTSLSVPTSSALYQFTGDFTVECWAYISSTSTTRNMICNWPGLNANNCAWNFQIYGPTGRLRFSYGIGGGNFAIDATTTTIPLNTWFHAAVTRSGSTVRLFVNGVQDATTGTVSGTLHNNPSPVYIGVLNPGEGQYWLGNISNARVVKGVAVYTTGFTPSTLPLPATQSANVYGSPSAAITGTQTSLLMNFTNLGMQNNTTFADVSTYASTVTATGAPYYAGLTPFTNTYPGSIKFNGTTQYLQNTSATSVPTGTGAYTVEGWVRFNSITANVGQTWMESATSGGFFFGLGIAYNGSNNGFRIGKSLVADCEYCNFTFSLNTWYHLAVVRSGTTIYFFVNGVQQTTQAGSQSTGSYSWPATSSSRVGASNGNTSFSNGWLSNWRTVNGVALYTANFTPSTLPLPATQSANVYGNPSAAITGTQTGYLLSTQTGGFYDLSTSGQQITNTTSSTTVKTVSATQQFKFGTQSNTLLPTAYQTVIDDTSLQYGTNDFTIEGWVYTNVAGVVYGLINKGASTPTGWSLEINASNQLVWYSTGTAVKTSTTTIPASTWTYVAISRSGTNLYMFINGTLQGTAGTDSANYNQTTNMIIGATRALGNGLNGYLDDLRITRYTARYTASFAAPTAAFPTIPGPSVDYLIVGGGGGGGGFTGAGGGAGGVLTGTFNNITAQAYAVTVGLGGAGGITANRGANGNVSTFNSFSSAGGGGGGTNSDGGSQTKMSGLPGGSGGGGSVDNGTGTGGAGNTPSTSPSQGSTGGIAYTPWGGGGTGIYATGGGGGASAVGANATTTKSGDGGAGVSSSISGTATTYGGGGGGGVFRASGTADAGGLGGAGGGGRGYGSSLFPAASGTPNTGGGGGGQGQNLTTIAGSGANGIVIIRYLTDGTNGVSNTSTGGTKTTSGAYTIHTFTITGTFTAVLT